ncbi:helix-turn-helix domain-containing protein [Halegenticoccus tardaugens]|uniref:helix-turn-helix domain-containing protein n=1 Tax=Halegenticoccus tardaugens TaxID=2071624 RepID=UPI00100B0B6F
MCGRCLPSLLAPSALVEEGDVSPSIKATRQHEAVTVTIDVGYYGIPRKGDYETVAAQMGCAPSTAAEHLRKAESKLLRSLFPLT